MIGFLVWLLIFWTLNTIFKAFKRLKLERDTALEHLDLIKRDLDLSTEYEEYYEGELKKVQAERDQYLELLKTAYEKLDEDFKELTIEEFESYIYFTDGKLDDN